MSQIVCLDLGSTKFCDFEPVTSPRWTAINLMNPCDEGFYDGVNNDIDGRGFVREKGKVGGDYNKMPFVDNTFWYALGTCYQEEEHDYKELFRVLKPGGIARVFACASYTFDTTVTRTDDWGSINHVLNNLVTHAYVEIKAATSAGFEFVKVTAPRGAIEGHHYSRGKGRIVGKGRYAHSNHRVRIEVATLMWTFRKPKEATCSRKSI